MKAARHPAEIDYDENGVDLDKLRYNLSLTPEQRIVRMQESIRSMMEFKHEAERARSKETP